MTGNRLFVVLAFCLALGACGGGDGMPSGATVEGNFDDLSAGAPGEVWPMNYDLSGTPRERPAASLGALEA